ncbi:MAG: NACHT domain-containing protein [Chloroflexi bacterium]|nr:NACHT domain-containing protein [Chloroflexota bacterium]
MRRWPITGTSVCLAVLALLASPAMAQPPTPTPTPAPPGSLGLSQDLWDKAILVLLGAVVALVFQKVLPWLWKQLGHLYDLVTAWVGWDLLGRFQRRYLAALCREHGYLKLIGIRTEGVNPPKLEEVYVSLRMVPPHLPGAAQVEAAPERVMGVGVALRECRRLVVLGAPGAGKTTLLDYLTLGFARGLPKEKRQELPQERLLPIFVPLRRGATTEKTLPEALTDPALQLMLPDLIHDCPPGFFHKRLEQGRCLVLLDGLDEVTSEAQYRTVVAKINSLVTTYPQNRYVVTCRKAGWRGGLGGDFTALEIQDFRPADVERFVQGWYRAVLPERVLRNFSGTKEERQAALERARQEAQGEADKLIAILKERERLGWLAANPMMLSLIAFVHYTRRDLPRGRAALYKECVEILLELWDKRDKELRLENAPSLAQKEAVLRQIAYDFQIAGRREAPRDELETVIAGMLPGLGCAIGAPAFLRQIEERSGLLVERAIDVLGFSHLTFQEYLAALVFKDDEPKRPELLAHRADQDWREVFLLYSGLLPQATDWLRTVWQAEGDPPLLAGRCLAEAVQVAPETREGLLAALNAAFRSVHDPALLWETGEVLAEVSGKDVADYFLAALAAPEVEVRSIAVRALGQPKQSLLPRVASALVAVAQMDAEVRVRVAALEVLGQLSLRAPVSGFAEIIPAVLRDADPAVRAAAAATLDTALVEVPAGPFLMGSDKSKDPQAWDSETPKHEEQSITRPCRIGKYPVTNAQYARFVAAGGYDNQGYWTEAGWRWKGDRRGPGRYGGDFEQPEYPVVGVSWYEATAYCRWLAETTGQPYRLPSEAEWEKAARGKDGRIWPWGNQFDPKKCNSEEGRIGHTTPVGQFSPAGDSPYGCADVAGNVWEWCQSKWVGNYQHYNRGVQERESLEGGDRRVLRGGSFSDDQWYVRCAYRDWFNPVDFDWGFGFRLVVSPL